MNNKIFSESSVSSVVKYKIREIGVICGFAFLLLCGVCLADFDPKQEVIKFMQEIGADDMLHAPVTVSQTRPGLLLIEDEGIYAIQHDLLEPTESADPNVIVAADAAPRPSAKYLCIVTHGWLDKGQNKWPEEKSAIARSKLSFFPR